MTRGKDNRKPLQHPAVSGRIMSVEEFRAAVGRTTQRRTAARRPANTPALPLVARNTEPLSTLPFETTLPFLPPSVNGLFVTVRDRESGALRRVLSDKARRVRKAIQHFVRGRLAQDGIYEFRITFELPALTKGGGIRKVDLSNRVKFLEDCVASCLAIDDRQFFRIVLTKLHAEHERTIISILPFTWPATDAA